MYEVGTLNRFRKREQKLKLQLFNFTFRKLDKYNSVGGVCVCLCILSDWTEGLAGVLNHTFNPNKSFMLQVQNLRDYQ